MPAGVLGMEPLERLRKPGVGDALERVVVATEQDVGEQRELEPLPSRGQALEKVFPVPVAYVQVALVASVSGQVVDRCVEVARVPGHAFEARPRPSPPGSGATVPAYLRDSFVACRP